MTDQAEMQSPEDRLTALLETEDPVTEEERDEPEQEDTEAEAEEEDSQEETAEPVKLKLKRGDEEVEVDIEEAKNLAQMGYDYTKKTQEVAEQRKAIEMHAQALKAQEQTFNQMVESQQAFIKDIAKLESINDQIAQFESVDWNALSDNDPVQAQKLFIQYQNLNTKRTQMGQEIQQKHNQLQQQRNQNNALRLEQERAELLKAFPDWNQERASELRDTAKQYGFNDEEVSGISDTRMVKVLADAAAYRKLQSQKANVTKKVADKPAVVKPGAKDTNAVARSKHSEMRQNLKKSGRYEDAAALIERMI